jgi:hypothetical protein
MGYMAVYPEYAMCNPVSSYDGEEVEKVSLMQLRNSAVGVILLSVTHRQLQSSGGDVWLYTHIYVLGSNRCRG